MSAVKITPFVASVPIADPQTGLPTEYFVKTIFPYFQRLGGYIDFVYQAQLAGNTGDATIAEVAATTQENAFLIQNLQALIAGGLAESLQQEISDLRQELARLNAQIQGIRGEDAAAQVQQVSVTVTQLSGDFSSLAAVATSGSYADLTGTPTLGTASDENTGTSGHALGFLDGNNTHSGNEAFTKPVAVPAHTVATLPSAATYTNGIAIATDLVAPATGTVVVGGGTVRGAVISDGTNWVAI